jgi:thiamine-monophosphate kinase
MKLKDIGEFGFIERFAHDYDNLISANDTGIGDDCAIIEISKTENHVITTDLLIEDIHFLKDKISPEHLGYKSLAVNLSDIAAMGAKPLHSFLSIGIPKNTEVDYLDKFMKGYKELSEKYHTPLMGGDTTRSADRLVINVVVVGTIKKSKMHLRSMAETGDLICVTGELGDSGGGLKVLLDKLDSNEVNERLIRKHNLPEPRINEGLWLSEYNEVHAMIDISDGIASDLSHVLKASQKSASVELTKIPISSSLKKASEKNGWNTYEIATGGGEDYELLLTIKKDAFNKINKGFASQFEKPLYPIGEIHEGDDNINWLVDGKEIDNKLDGFNHFV